MSRCRLLNIPSIKYAITLVYMYLTHNSIHLIIKILYKGYKNVCIRQLQKSLNDVDQIVKLFI